MKAWLPALCLPFVAALPAHAQMYKCTHGDSVTYSEAPCERGAQTVMAVPDSPKARAAPEELKRLQKESAALQKERLAREAQQARADALHDRQAARRRDACAKLELARKWAEDDVRRASHGTADAARLKARRAAERHAAECK
ncbi:DUF4124 domain-containing protein [Massilia dura]|uniref:DUF4124 domain-containing protein n=1 Tax=Pseudoduganella dura TaxID=321982 RepID=A0A6I3XSY6_9BURK|nr:DUF4124 domain-containing protein [Pseudoduganella dura]MUI16402.1 DUF4124 domain-containing protein [Pseudoduganella dura]GGX86513.1 hypothetical protein GCM10007386_16690 [Pseudoduganella dura]